MRLESEKVAEPFPGRRWTAGWIALVFGLLPAAACGRTDTAAVESIDGTPAGATDTAAAGVPPIPTGGPRVVILGTSLTAGLGLDPDSAWPALVQRMADSAGVPVTIVNAGLSGETSAGALRRADWVLAERADLVVLEVGANDGLRGMNPDSTRETLVALVERVRARQPAARIVLVQMEAPPNLGVAYTTRFREAYRAAADRAGIPLLPFLLEGVAGEAAFNQADGIHPNERGSHLVAATMWAALRPLVEPGADTAGPP